MSTLALIEQVNREVYERRSTIRDYLRLSLQASEIVIFVKYRDYIWNKEVMDIGCGAGRTSFFLTQFTPRYIGIDVSSMMVKHCRRKFPNADFIQCDVRDLGLFQSGRFDFILFSANGLDLIGHDARVTALGEIKRVLKDDGIFVFSAHNRRYLDTVWGGKSPFPRLRFNWNPKKQASLLKNFLLSTCNYLRHKKYEDFNEKYSVIVGLAHNHSVLSYWIKKEIQIAQLQEIGFEVLEMYDTYGGTGEKVLLDTDDRHLSAIYYVCRKDCRPSFRCD